MMIDDITMTIGSAFAIAGFVIAGLFAWWRLNTKIAQNCETLSSIKHVAESRNEVYKDFKESTDKFFSQMAFQVENFRDTTRKRQEQCDLHSIMLQEIKARIKEDSIINENMRSLFKDLKQIQTSTASAIVQMTNTISKIEVTLNQLTK